jgi:hypothetical protein
MKDLFIPPEGAMQFEVFSDPEGNPAPYTIVIWVVKSEAHYRGRNGCPHNKGFEIIMESLPPIMKSCSGMTRAGICECRGRIIE